MDAQPASTNFMRELPEHDSYENRILDDKPLAYWPLTDRPGSAVARDRSGRGRDGKLSEGVSFGGDGPMDASTSATFDGTGMITVGEQPGLGRSNNFTIEAWIWIDDPDQHGRIIVADKGNRPGRNFGWDLTYSPAVGPLPSPKGRNCLKFTFMGSRAYYFEEAPIEPSRWHHIAVVSMQNGHLGLFIDGKLAQLLNVNARGKVGPTHVTLGRAAGMRVHEAYWKGRLAHVAFYDRALEPDEIYSHYTLFDTSTK